MKRFFVVFLVLFICFSLASCGKDVDQSAQTSNPDVKQMEEEPLTDEVSSEEKTYTKDFGSYTIPAGWVESKVYSSSSKFFYVLSGTEKEEKPNNISVNMGTNRYAAADHMQFRDAIVQQLLMQMSESPDAELDANGSNTDHDYILYTFRIKNDTGGVETTQYYIVGEKRYVLVHETVTGESEETDAAAKMIVNSFVWAK